MSDDDEILGPSARLEAGPMSMQAVGQPNLSDSLLGALNSSPRFSDEAILSLVNQQPTAGQRLAQSLAGGVAIMRGQPNPVTATLNQQQQQRTDLATMMFRMNQTKQQEDQQLFSRLLQAEQARDQRLQRIKTDADKITDSLINSDDPAARLLGWTQRAAEAQRLGRPIDPNLLQSLSRGSLGKDTLQHAADLTLTDMTDAEIVDLYKGQGLQLKHMPFVRQMAQNDDLRQRMGLTRNEDLQMKRDDMQLKRIQAQLAEMREERMGRAQEASARRQEELLEQGNRRIDLAERNASASERRAAESERHNRVAEDQRDRSLELMRERLEKSIGTKDEKRVAMLAAMEDGLNQMEWRAKNLDTKNFLPKGTTGIIGGLLTGDPSAAKAKAVQQMYRHDDDWRAWENLNALATGLDRTVLNEIGARAKEFSAKQMAMFSDPPSLSAILEFTKSYRKFIRDARDGRLPETETVTVRMPDGSGKVMVWRRGTPFPPIPPGGIIVSVE